jgi:hypothetical protein
MRMQVEEQKPKEEIKQPVREKSKTTFRCSSRFCHTQDPSSNTLCNECISQQYPTSSKIPNISQETSSTSSHPYNRSFYDSKPKPRKIDQLEGRHECYEDESNSMNDAEHIYYSHDHRPEQTKPSSAKYSERFTSFETNDSLEESKPSAQNSPYVSSTKKQEERSIARSGHIRIKFKNLLKIDFYR